MPTRTSKKTKGSAPDASCLNVSKGVVSQWERGERRPVGSALKLLALAEKNGRSAIA